MPIPEILLFAKAPQLGRVKTRLAADVGPDEALRAYQHLLDVLFQQLQDVQGMHLTVVGTPTDSLELLNPWMRKDWKLEAQSDGNLGTRLLVGFQGAFQRGSQPVLAIGADCPGVAPSDLLEAMTQLKTQDLVLGPAVDGGYWLIGMNRLEPGLFQDMPWSQPNLLEETLDKAQKLGLRTGLLRTLEDVDTREEWERFLMSQPSGATHRRPDGLE